MSKLAILVAVCVLVAWLISSSTPPVDERCARIMALALSHSREESREDRHLERYMDTAVVSEEMCQTLLRVGNETTFSLDAPMTSVWKQTLITSACEVPLRPYIQQEDTEETMVVRILEPSVSVPGNRSEGWRWYRYLVPRQSMMRLLVGLRVALLHDHVITFRFHTTSGCRIGLLEDLPRGNTGGGHRGYVEEIPDLE